MKDLLGKWRLEHEKDDNFEEYLKAIGLNFAFRKLGKAVVPTEELKQVDEETWSLQINVPARHTVVVFQVGQEIQETTMDGRKCISTFQIDEEGVLIQYQKSTNPEIPDSMITRKRQDHSTIVQVYEAVGRNIKSTRKFVRMD